MIALLTRKGFKYENICIIMHHGLLSMKWNVNSKEFSRIFLRNLTKKIGKDLNGYLVVTHTLLDERRMRACAYEENESNEWTVYTQGR